MISKLPDCIVNLIRELNSVTDVTNEIVSEVMVRAGLSEDALFPYNLFNHTGTESYGRRLLYESDKFRILLMTWNPGDFTAIHNHGVTEWGGVYFFGNATHRLYETEYGNLKLSRKDIFEKGQTAAVCGDLTHLMGNSGKTGFMTLHIYGSNKNLNDSLNKEKVFLPEHKLLATTSGPAFLNVAEEIKTSEEFFNNYTEETLLDYFDLIKPFYMRNKRDDLLLTISSFEKDIDTYYNNENQ
ncbi:MAG: cysteine dioxygenase family protein [Bacteroidales bacterium]|nr:cysteine dioxygenase family protein [Bacteroidales bacterium]